MKAFRKVDLPGIPGGLYLHSMPGRQEALEQFSAQVAARQIGRVICLAGMEELRQKSPGYAQMIEQQAAPWQQEVFAIPDFGVPADREALRTLAQAAAGHLRGGENLLVHCGAGIGRTGMFAALALLALGYDLPAAAEKVQQAGSGAETDAQRALLEWARSRVVR